MINIFYKGYSYTSQTLKAIGRFTFAASSTITAYGLFENAMSNLFSLQNLRHGTSPHRYVLMHIGGAQKKRGGDGEDGALTMLSKILGSSRNIFSCGNQDKDRVFVWDDSEFKLNFDDKYKKIDTHLNKNLPSAVRKIYTAYTKTCLISFYINQTSNRDYVLSYTSKIKKTAHAYISTFILSSLLNDLFIKNFQLPVKMHYTPEEKKKVFSQDQNKQPLLNKLGFLLKDLKGASLYTKKDVSPLHIGPLGIVYQGVSNLGSWPERAINNPLKVLTGVVQLVCSFYMAANFAHTYLPQKYLSRLPQWLQELKPYFNYADLPRAGKAASWLASIILPYSAM